MKKVLMIGPAPNRIGGVSTHINRLTSLLSGSYEFDFIDEGRGKQPGYFNLRSLNFLTYFRKLSKADVVHIHSGVFLLRLFHVLFAKILFRKYVIVSVHHDLAVEGHIGITRKLLSYCNCAILDSQVIYDSVYKKTSHCCYKMMPAFLPPIEVNEEMLPDYVEEWIKNVKQDSNSVLMCSSSYSIGDFNGADLYGNDLSIDAVKNLNKKNTGRSFYLLMILHNSDKHPEKLKLYKNKIEQVPKGHVLLLTESINFISVIKKSDVVLRPTNTDGDSITIREALFYSKPIVASDCVDRPEGTCVFKTRDIEDFCDKILLAVDGNENKKVIPIDYKSFYIDCYENYSGVRK